MTRPGTTTPSEPGLSDAARAALLDELFAQWEAEQPGCHKCFCGSDEQLIEAVERYRDDQDRERG